MKLKTLLIIKALVCLFLGIPILLVPVFIYSIFGAELAEGGVFAAREYGAAMMGILMLTWFAKDSQKSDAQWAMILGLFVYDLAGCLIAVKAVLTAVLNPLGWLIVILYLFFTLGFGYFLIPGKIPEAG